MRLCLAVGSFAVLLVPGVSAQESDAPCTNPFYHYFYVGAGFGNWFCFGDPVAPSVYTYCGGGIWEDGDGDQVYNAAEDDDFGYCVKG